MLKKFTLYLVLGFVILGLMAFTQAPRGTSVSTGMANSIQASVDIQAAVMLSDAEIANLLRMREEEKLAHDVYITLYDKWNLNTFENIAASEQIHTDTVKSLLDAYGLADPAAGKAAGVFTDPEMQKLYDSLIQQGGKSLSDAIKVGGAIEEIDILDLRKAESSITAADIKTVYANLKNGSENHLRAFAGTLERQTGETYQPQYMTQEEFQSAIAGGTGNGRNDAGPGNGNGGNGLGAGKTDDGVGTGVGSGNGNGRRGGRS